MRKKKGLLWTIIIVVVALVGTLAVWLVPMWTASYYAVYLTTGDIYYGKLITFPTLKLVDAWYLQRDEKNQASITRFSQASWGPQGDIKLSSDSVVWMAEVSEASPILPILKGQQIQQQQQPIQSKQIPPEQSQRPESSVQPEEFIE